MKATIRHTITLFLTLCILLSSVGVALSAQLCLMTGLKQATAQEQMDGCCEKPAAKAAKTDDCCAVKTSFEKLEPVSTLKAFQLEAPVFFLEPLSPFPTFRTVATKPDQRVLTYADSSPPLYGRTLLQFIHILII
ncbi:hypothetical protein [Pontibacter sp. SGAir0037]|uniref:HYC_CC_PP family protein n=1 Tax=Pontibacter sp. SGAir0037 TaxID=2571030 RepID=UPI001F114E8C|nr:hypothetical protein [Pontibacter sp. SGAir0037]